MMDRQTWHEEFAPVEQRIQRNLDKLREHNEEMAALIRDAERRRSRARDAPQ
jgi:hypothetical protein